MCLDKPVLGQTVLALCTDQYISRWNREDGRKFEDFQPLVAVMIGENGYGLPAVMLHVFRTSENEYLCDSGGYVHWNDQQLPTRAYDDRNYWCTLDEWEVGERLIKERLQELIEAGVALEDTKHQEYVVKRAAEKEATEEAEVAALLRGVNTWCYCVVPLDIEIKKGIPFCTGCGNPACPEEQAA